MQRAAVEGRDHHRKAQRPVLSCVCMCTVGLCCEETRNIEAVTVISGSGRERVKEQPEGR